MVSVDSINISTKFKNSMVKQALKEAPNECCGVLLGRNNIIERIVPMQSTDPSPDTYFMDPVQQVEMFAEMEKRGESLLGIYHSHPAGPRQPSGADLQLAFHPEAVYIIVSLKDSQNPEVGAFLLAKGEFKEIKIEYI